MVHVRCAIAALLLCLAAPASAQQFTTSGPTRPSPQITLSVGGSDVNGIFINWFKGAAIGLSTNSPSVFDANGYPNSGSLTANLSISIAGQPSLATYSGTWEEGWSGTGAHQYNETLIMVSDPQNCTGVLVGATFSLIHGTNCDVTFNYQSNPIGSGYFPSTGTYTNMAGAFLVRTSDKAAYLAGQVFTPEWISVLKQLNPLSLRTMGMSFPNQSAENETSWAVRIPTNALSYNSAYYPPSVWAGTDSTHTDNYVLGSYPSMPTQWTDSEVFQFEVTNASTAQVNATAAANDGGLVELTVSASAGLSSVLLTNCQSNAAPKSYSVTIVDPTHVTLQGSTFDGTWSSCGSGIITTTTINVGSRGAKFAVTEGVLGGAGIAASAAETCHYDALLSLLLCSAGGINAGIPPEIQVEQSNEAGRPFWGNIPPFWQASDVTSWASYVSSHLFSGLDFYAEFNNENWNFVFQAQNWTQRGFAIGLPLSSAEAEYSYIGLRHRQLMPSVVSAWTHSRSLLHLIGGAQAFGTPSLFALYEFSGSALCGTSCSNSTYQSAIGVDYNVSPNRPMDFMDDYSIATYFSGAQANGNDSTATLADLQPIINAATQYASGTPTNIQTALNFIDTDTRSGTCGGCGGASFTISSINTNIFPGWNTQASTDSKSLIAYEGGYSSFGQTAAFLTGLGDTGSGSCTGCNGGTTDATQINNLLIAYRASPQYYSTYLYQNAQWMGFSKVVGNSNLQVIGYPININSQSWWIMIGGLYPAKPFQSFNALGFANGGLN